MDKKVAITGGGSGGHTSAAIGIIECLIEVGIPRENILWIGSKTGTERKVSSDNLIKYAIISVGKLRRYWSLENFLDIPRVLKGAFQSLRILKHFKPEIVIGTGGYVSVPVVLAARLLKIPIIIHEQTIIPGLANRISGRFASKIVLSFEDSKQYFDEKKSQVIGNPLRAELRGQLPERLAVLSQLQLEPSLPVIYVTGGSQGANSLNKAVGEALPKLLQHWQMVHQFGTASTEYGEKYLRGIVDSLPGSLAKRYKPLPYIGQNDGDMRIVDVFAVADLMVSRSGAGTVNEIIRLGIPSILVPYPHSVAQEQYYLARILEDAGASILLDESDLSAESLCAIVQTLNQQELKNLKANLSSLSRSHFEVEKRIAKAITSVMLKR